MDIETRLENLENLVNSLIEMIKNNKFYTDADIAGCRQGIGNVTPTTFTKSAYIGDTELIFEGIPSGQITVHAEDSEGHFPIFDMNKDGSTLTVYFEPLENVAIFTVSIL